MCIEVIMCNVSVVFLRHSFTYLSRSPAPGGRLCTKFCIAVWISDSFWQATVGCRFYSGSKIPIAHGQSQSPLTHAEADGDRNVYYTMLLRHEVL